jgi:hypothetical protein
MKEKTKVTMKTDPETIARRAYHAAEGNISSAKIRRARAVSRLAVEGDPR